MKCVLVVLLTHASGEPASAFSGSPPMTGFRRRGGFSALTALSCGAFHPIPFLSSAAAKRTTEPQEHTCRLIRDRKIRTFFPEECLEFFKGSLRKAVRTQHDG